MIISYALMFILTVFSGTVYSQSFDENRLIVTGGVELSAPTDNAGFSFEVTGMGATLAEAVGNARNKVASISGELFQVGLSPSNLHTSFFHSGENFEGKVFYTSRLDYKATITVMVNVDNLELLETAIIKVSESDVSRISNISFWLEDYELLKENALEKAALKAKNKAELMAKATGAILGNVLYVEEMQVTKNHPVAFNASFEMRSEDALDIIQGKAGFFAQEVKLNARVRLIIELQDNSK